MSKNDTLSDEQKSKLCLKCRYCCEYVHIPLVVGVDYIPFYKGVRGMDIRFNNFKPWLILHNPCQHLIESGCAIYNKRPDTCKYFDGRTMLFDSNKCLWKGGN